MLPPTPDPPFRVGQRVRCGVDTLVYPGYASSPLPRTQVYGRAGTVDAVAWLASPQREPPRWQVSVRYDHLTDTTWHGGLIRHRPEDLVPVEEWA